MVGTSGRVAMHVHPMLAHSEVVIWQCACGEACLDWRQSDIK